MSIATVEFPRQFKSQNQQTKDSNSNNLIEQLQQNLQNLIVADNPNNTSKEETEKQQQHHQQQQEYFTRDLMDISRTNIVFTKTPLFPGSIDECQVVFGLRDDILFDQDPRAAYLVRVITACHNNEFSDLDEYVVSVRSNQRYEYFQQIRYRIRKKQRAGIKVAIKIPPVKQSQIIEGTLTLQLQNTVPVYLQISAKCEVPKIICLKDLYDVVEKTHIIKIPAKKSVRMPPIPFKNLSSFNFLLEIEVASDANFSKRAYDIIAQNSVSVQAHNPFFVNLQLRTNQNYRGVMPLTDTIRKVLILKIKNSSLCFSFPIQAFVYQSSTSSLMS